MKRLFVLGLAVMAFGASLFAGGKGAIIESLDTKATQNAILRYLGTDVYQKSDMEFIFSMSQKDYKDALAKGYSEHEAFYKAVGVSLLRMKDVLTSDQYQKFKEVLGQTVKNNETNTDSYYVDN